MIARAPAAALPLLLLLAGCGASPSQADVTSTAADFESAVAGQDLERACALLSDSVLESLDGSCPTKLQEADLPAGTGSARTEVWGQNGQVRWQGETLFLSRFPTGWKVTAAGCSPKPAQPYDCSVSGG
jgi:hypothetical protein